MVLTRIIFTIISLLLVFSNAFAYQLAGLESETAEELLMFYEEEELVIATRNTTSVRKAIATVITAREIRKMGARNLTWIGKRSRDDRYTRDDLPADLTLIAKNFYETLEIRGSVYNLFDEYYLDPNPYPGQVHNDYPANKRMFLAGVRYTF